VVQDEEQGRALTHQSPFLIYHQQQRKSHGGPPLAQQLARTLSLIHANGVVHRNLGTSTVCPRHPALPGGGRRAVLTDFTLALAAAAVTVSASGSVPPTESEYRPLVARVGMQCSPVPELLLRVPLPGATEPGAQVPSTCPLVDVWGLGVVPYMLACARVPFDVPTLDALRKASLSVRSPESLWFPKRVSRDVCPSSVIK